MLIKEIIVELICSHGTPLENIFCSAATYKMDFNSLSQLCLLCQEFQGEFSSDVGVIEKIEKYLHIKMEYSSIQICTNCFNVIQAFHSFYLKVHEAQENLKNKSLIQFQEKSTEQLHELNKTESFLTNTQEVLKSEISQSEEKVPIKEANCPSSDATSKTESKKQKHSKLKEISTEIEKKMLEFYNIKCEKCDEGKFTSFKMLSKHYATVHNTQGYIKCCKRNIRVNDKYYLRSHMFKHLQPETCRCRVCGKELSSLATLKHHMILHKPTEERPFQCSKCDKGFCCKNDLKNHEKSIHLPENEREDFICDVCGKVFQKVANLRYHHSTVHLQERKYICEVCAKCFTTQSGLRTHINATHSSLGPIQCHECNKWLKTKDTYQKHLQLHQNNSYPCSHCEKVCNSSAGLRSHLVKHSEERPHSCTICKKSFKTKIHLKNHSSQHIGGSHYKCPYCSKLFVNMSNYYTHKRRMHMNEAKAKNLEYQPRKSNLEQSSSPQMYDFKATSVITDGSVIRQNIIVSPIKYL